MDLFDSLASAAYRLALLGDLLSDGGFAETPARFRYGNSAVDDVISLGYATIEDGHLILTDDGREAIKRVVSIMAKGRNETS